MSKGGIQEEAGGVEGNGDWELKVVSHYRTESVVSNKTSSEHPNA